MPNPYDKPMTLEELQALPDEEIDYSDIPELDEEFWQNAQVVLPACDESIAPANDKKRVHE
jgi:hypothetical protein